MKTAGSKMKTTLLRANRNSLYLNIIILVSFFVSWLLSVGELFALSGLVLIFASLGSYIYLAKQTETLVNSRGIFILFWMGAIGLSALKIHPFQQGWKLTTWVYLWLSICIFLVGYDIGFRIKENHLSIKFVKMNEFTVLIVLSCIILFVFMIEIVSFGTFPIFSSNMSAYKDFAMPYLHYITVSCALIPPLILLYFKRNKTSSFQKFILISLFIINIAVPILIVSRQLLLLELYLIVVVFIKNSSDKKKSIRYVIIILTIGLLGWMLISGSRNQNDAYLIQQLSLDEKLPVGIYNIYLYISFGIDNFNDIVGNISGLTFGVNVLRPLLTFTFLDGLISPLVSIEIPRRIISGFGTYTSLFAPYLDFKGFGIILISLLLGVFAGKIEKNEFEKNGHILKYAITNYCLAFFFFDGMFYKTDIWVYFIIISIYNMLSEKMDK